MQAIITSILFLISGLVFRVANADYTKLSASFDKIIRDTKLDRQYLSFYIEDPHGEKIYSLNPERKIIPASLSKLATAAAVLEKMPVGHQFITELRINSNEVEGTTLKGNLFLKGGGDAAFVSESMWFLVNEFVRNEIQIIKGDIIVDDSLFDDIRFDESREQTRVDKAYDAPVGAMTFNWSAVNVFIRPGNKVGEPAKIFADPKNEYIKIVNKTKTVGSGKSIEVTVSNNGITEDKKNETIYVRGTVPIGAEEKVEYKSIVQPAMWTGHQLKEFLAQRQIKVEGTVRLGKTPPNAKVVAINKSKPVGETVSDMLKYSNNYIAEILTKNLAVVVKNEKGTMVSGVKVIQDYLRSIGLKDFVFENPSGLSRRNQFRAEDILRLLHQVKGNFSLYPEYLSGLPIGGVDGTLKRRLKKDDFKGRVRAKTGHLSGVNGLAGFMSDSEGNAYPFVFAYNGPVKDAYGSQYLFDKIIAEFLRTY